MPPRDAYDRQPWERAADPPPGWARLPAPGGFNFTFGAVYVRRDGAALSVGFRCTERHLNPSGYCHGSALAAFSDMMAYGIQHMVGYDSAVVPTVSMVLDFLAVVRLGDWVAGRCEVTRETRHLVFAEMRCAVDDRPVMNARAIFKKMAMADLADTGYFDAVGPEIARLLAEAG